MSSQSCHSTIVEATIPEMQRAMLEKKVTSRDLVKASLARIEKYGVTLNAVMTINPRALEEAEARDRERAAGRVRGPLHGIPIAIKDNIQTIEMPTTGGALAFKGFVPPYEATLVKNLRDAGAVIIAKTTMTELANWVASGMPNDYNAILGYALNPYDPRRDPRTGSDDGRPALNTGGSSSGAGTAVSSGLRTSALRRQARSCLPQTRTCLWPSSRQWGGSAAMAWSRSRLIRTRPVPWPGP